jgi:Domain of unknown function (DUF4263)
MKFERTYLQRRGPKVPSFQAYAKRIKRDFKLLLASTPDERAMQDFLETNPCMVPGSKTPGGSTGHWPLHLALIARPPLHGFGGRIPDFMWLSKHSGAFYPAMIEIERPDKLIFTPGKGIPSADFNQARHQLVQWRVWLDEPANSIAFMDHYGVGSRVRLFCEMGRHFILVYGRRSEFARKPALSRTRGSLLTGDEELMSFDRLAPESDMRFAVTVTAAGSGQFKVIAVPETFALSPANARFLPNYIGLADAIEQNPNISRHRCAFLRERIDYWVNWVAAGEEGITGGDYWE